MAKKPFRFSWQAFEADTPDAWRAKARKCEELGYSALQLADHYLGPGSALEAANHPVQSIAALPAMMVALAETKTLKVGCRVFCTGYKPAGVLIKEAMTAAFFYEGRTELGLGAGWVKSEYDAMGIDFPEAPRRIDRLEETIQIAKQHMAGTPLSVDGQFAKAVDYEPLPVPQQKVPLMIGGGGPRMMKLAGREADIVSINFNNRSGMIGPDSIATSTPEETAKKVAKIKEGAGDRFDDLEIEIGAYFSVLTDAPQQTAEAMAGQFGITAEQLMAFPHALVGDTDMICDELERRREAYGVSYVAIPDSAAEMFAPVVARMTGK